jgi:cytosine/adenosine deaminase-related metal-dependent hydrolase
MVLDAGKRGHGRKPSGEDIPEDINRTIEIIKKYGLPGNLTEINAAPMIIVADPEADAQLSRLNEKYDCIYDRHEAEQCNEAMAFWARAFEKVCKLSMLYAVSQNPVKPIISVDAVKWASAFVEYVTDQMLFMVDNYSYENVFDEKCRKAVRYIREAGGRVAHGVLLKRMHEPKEVFKQIIETMEENGTITHEIKGTGPSMTKFYILR